MKKTILLFILLMTSAAKSHEFLLDFLINTGYFDGYTAVAGNISLNYDELIIEFDEAHTANLLSKLQFQPHILQQQVLKLVQIINNPEQCRSTNQEGDEQNQRPMSCGGDFHEVMAATAIRVASEQKCKEYSTDGQVLIPEYISPPEFIVNHDTFILSEFSENIVFNCVKMISIASDY